MQFQIFIPWPMEIRIGMWISSNSLIALENISALTSKTAWDILPGERFLGQLCAQMHLLRKNRIQCNLFSKSFVNLFGSAFYIFFGNFLTISFENLLSISQRAPSATSMVIPSAISFFPKENLQNPTSNTISC